MFTQRDRLTHTYGKMNKNNLKKYQHSLSNAGPPDMKYLCYPHVEDVTPKGSLSPASIYKSKNITILMKIIKFSSYTNFNLHNFNLPLLIFLF